MKFDMRPDNIMSQDTKASQSPRFVQHGDLKSLYDQFWINDSDIVKMMRIFDESLDSGLSISKEGKSKSSLKMLLTYLHETLYPRHTGMYIALDLGGTNLRFLTIELRGTEYRCKSEHVMVPNELLIGNSDDLFDFIAKFLFDGIKKHKVDCSSIPYVGFTFSFPLEQDDLCHGKLLTWTKGYNVSGVEGENIADLLKKSSEKLGLHIDRFAIVNDTAGTLLSGALEHTNCYIGIINGTGSNACYMEDISKIGKYKGLRFSRDEMIINIEWGAFGDNDEISFIRNKYDVGVDDGSIRVGAQRFEKMISGMYLGEIARLVMLDLIKSGHLFGGITPAGLLEPYRFETKYLSHAYNLINMKAMFETEFGVTINQGDADILSSFFDVIVFRAAQLSAAALSVLVKRIDKQNVVIAADGSMFKRNPTYMDYTHNLMKKYIAEKDISIVLAEDGSGKGAAIAAAVATCCDESLKNANGDMSVKNN